MGWFSKKNKKDKLETQHSIPEIPKLPELPSVGNDLDDLPKLPSYPSNSLGEKFSHNAIKDIVSGEKIGDNEVFNANESFHESKKMKMQKPPRVLTKEISTKKIKNLPRMGSDNFSIPRAKEIEPVFVRMDKFEESLEMFEQAKRKIIEIEKFLAEIKSVREKELNS